ncbi:two-component system, NarL family, sensor histidine kinase LiaS [Desulfotomaculum arcticum]|uniref:Sensor histidine kinase n=1 Tax=Desulfotruncus arcticus DSM 17038 TaxID=1121424 RepID=A0A1I2REE0_9FIRM|nr:sensor histidine kinase [Desulfotruncus arcticus]SFG38413.1 two-component system, NarL family, sensor histidine kinase LiaS [Desulfotomaculum arcticum] [Desulfotruncus arcticus DSM 17038]
MNRMKLSNIQWQWIRYTIGFGMINTVLLLLLLWIVEGRYILEVVLQNVLGIPLLLVLMFIIMLLGTMLGFMAGKRMKRRLDELEEASMAYERGKFSYRVPDLGTDEIGVVGKRLNNMSSRVEEQIASMQRLSAEKAEWNETLKQAAVTAERQRLARELHDAVSQQLFAISMMTSAVQKTIKQQPQKAARQMAMIEEMAGIAQSEMRALLLHLRPAHLEGKGLKEGVEDLLQELEQKHDLLIKWSVEPLPQMAKGIEDHLFRIIQEAISNVLRHAKAKSLQLNLAVVQNQIRMKIQDDGIGFSSGQDKHSSYGLRTMYERVNEIGGVLDIFSLPQKGTQIDVKVPLVQIKEEGNT